MSNDGKSRQSYVFDANLEFKDAGLVAADAAATVDGSAKIVDVGSGLFRGDLVVDVSAIEIASNDEHYEICVQGSNSATFASGIDTLAVLSLGALEVTVPASAGAANDVDSSVGRYILPFRNERNAVWYRYLRVYTEVTGAIASGGGINFTAFASRT